MTETAGALDQLAIDTIRTLSIDAVQKANSGHPGAPMGMAPMAYTLWTRFLRHAPSEPTWPNRDRFLLSAGHASMLLYSLLYLTGYGLTLEDLESFRQWGSQTPGHPEHGHTTGVEATTGPLGQGFANGVGMAIAERRLATEFNRPGHSLIDHYVYAICSDGDLQEGISAEAASLAGPPAAGQARLPLRRQPHPARRAHGHGLLRWTSSSASTRTAGTRPGSRTATTWPPIEAAIEAARADERPSLIAVRTHIGYGAPTKHDSQKAHGSPLGEEEVRGAKQSYGWDPDKHFFVPGRGARALPRGRARGPRSSSPSGSERLARYARDYPAEAAELRRRLDLQAPRRLGRRASRATPSATAWPRARPARRRSTPWPDRCRSSSAARPTSPSRT